MTSLDASAEPLDLDALKSLAREARERAEAATQGPWRVTADTPWGAKVIANESGEMFLGVSATTTPPLDGWSAEARERAYALGRNKCNDAVFIASARTHVPRLADALDSALDEVERLRAALNPFVRCPFFGHTDDTRRRRIDCSDDQCRNPECIRYVECTHRSHDAKELLASGASTPSEPQ